MVWFDLSCVHFHPTPDVLDMICIWRLASIIAFKPCQHRHSSVAKSIVLLELKWVLIVPKHLLYRFQKIFIYEVNVRMLVEVLIKDYQLPTPWMLIHPQTITETLLRSRNRIACGFIPYPFFSHILHVHH